MLILMRTESPTPTIYGCFFQGKVPPIPQTIASGEDGQDVPLKDGDFAFYYQPELKRFNHFQSVEELALVQVLTMDKENMGLTVGGSFMTVSFCPDFQKCFGYIDELTPFPSENLLDLDQESFLNHLPSEKVQIWAHNSNASKHSQAQPPQAKPVERLTSLSTDCNHPWVSQACSYSLYRPNPVYLVPSHLTLETLQHIIIKRQGNARLAVTNLPLDSIEGKTVQEVYDEFASDKERMEEANQILDIEYDSELMRNNTSPWKQPFKSEGEGQPESFSSESVSALYAPQMSFFTHFEGKGGVSQIINVTLMSLDKWWKSETLAAGWKQWLQELHTFA